MTEEPTRHTIDLHTTMATMAAWVRDYVRRRVYWPLGFQKGYNFLFFFVFGGAFMAFTLARLQFLDIHGAMCNPATAGPWRHAAPGECFYFVSGATHERVGIILHLAGVLPAALMACLQFVPVVRRRYRAFHRANGYVVLLLVVLGSVGALMITRNAFGGTLATQSLGVVQVAMVLVALGMAWTNIRRLQIEQHRAWMLRAWFYVGAVITVRILMSLGAAVVTAAGGYYLAEPCDKLESLLGNRTSVFYPECSTFFDGKNPTQHATVVASMKGRPENIAAALSLANGMAGWTALFLHAVGVEIYLRLTPGESERLRNVSYQRQLEAGLRQPGRAGLTADRLGDGEKWKPKEEEEVLECAGSGGSTSEGGKTKEDRHEVDQTKNERQTEEEDQVREGGN